MSAVIQTEYVNQYAKERVCQSGIYGNDYFSSLQNGSMSQQEFILTQEQFYYAVNFFSRPMTALMARIPNAGKRLSILENIVEEHGSFRESAFHETTFIEFLMSMGVAPEKLEELILWPEVRAFNSTLMTACVFDEPEVGIGCLGAIELMFAEISSIIGRAAVERSWCSSAELKHYRLHSEIDSRHAADFFNTVEEYWGMSEKQYFIKQGIDMGVYIFDRFYKDLGASAKHFLYTV